MDTVSPGPVKFLGLYFDNAGMNEIVTQLLARPRGAFFAYAVTPNADHLVRLRHSPTLRAVYQGAAYCLLDSQMLRLCAEKLRLLAPKILTGADLTEALLAQLDDARVAVIGMTPDVIAALASRYKKIQFLHHNPPMQLISNPPAFRAAVDFACATQADFTFLALGSPVQEVLAYAIAGRREATGFGLCVGAALEFCAGTQRRAPAWMRRHGLEWLHRLAQDPLRLAGRYLISDPVVFVYLIAEAIRKRKVSSSFSEEKEPKRLF